MKFMYLILVLFLIACSTSSSRDRMTTRTIYYQIIGKPVELETKLRQAFKNKVKKHDCWEASDFAASTIEAGCAKFVEYKDDYEFKLRHKLEWSRTLDKRNMILKLRANLVGSTYSYEWRLECFDGKEIYGCANPGKFEFNSKGAKGPSIIANRLFENHLILGIK